MHIRNIIFSLILTSSICCAVNLAQYPGCGSPKPNERETLHVWETRARAPAMKTAVVMVLCVKALAFTKSAKSLPFVSSSGLIAAAARLAVINWYAQ